MKWIDDVQDKVEKYCILVCMKPHDSICRQPGECHGKNATEISQLFASVS